MILFLSERRYNMKEILQKYWQEILSYGLCLLLAATGIYLYCKYFSGA